LRKVTYGMLVSLDGYINGPNGELDWALPDEELHRFVNEKHKDLDVSLYGRRMYEVMDYWRTADQDPSLSRFELEFARVWQSRPIVVFSRTLDHVEGNARFVRDNAGVEISKLKSQPGKAMELGGAGIASSVIPLGLVDQYELYVHPVVLGRGTPMFQNLDKSLELKLVETRTFSSGVVYLRYVPADRA
jgi:dihydrofolate reductase